ncbi:hypothetical protein [Nitrosomonas sp. Is79A3]|uniref:hypothetical protein n=1 Tax=Nitrosomonas sp. (strain Is79A3) TaxID=261292 RepID=UPI000314FF6F
MGEIKFEKKTLVEVINTTLQETEQTAAEQSVATPGGWFHVRWDEGGSTTALGHWGNYRSLPSFWKFPGYSPAGWMDVQWITPVPMHPR